MIPIRRAAKRSIRLICREWRVLRLTPQHHRLRPRVKRSLQRQLHKRHHTRLLRPSTSRNVEHLDVILADEGCQSLTGALVAAAFAEVQPRLAMLPGKLRRALRSAGQLSGNREDDCAVRIADVKSESIAIGLARSDNMGPHSGRQNTRLEKLLEVRLLFVLAAE